MDISTLNLINTEIAELKQKQLKSTLDMIDMKRLEALIRMKKDLYNIKDYEYETDMPDEELFSDEEILLFLKERKNKTNNANANTKAKKKKAVSKKKKTSKKRKTKDS